MSDVEPCSCQVDDSHWHEFECPQYASMQVPAKVNAKRVEMQRKLQTVSIDTTKLRKRTLSPHSLLVNLTLEGQQQMRLDLAKEILLAMVNVEGDRREKVRAAVEYADLLLAEIES